MTTLTLASTSPSRRRILEAAGLRVRCVAPGVDERSVVEGSPERLAVTLALLKAQAVARLHPDAWVVGADQVVTDDAAAGAPRIWGKPPGPAEHLARLREMRGRPHDVVTGYAVLAPGVEHVGTETTRLWMRADLTDAELAAYVATGEGSGCAGGYAVEGNGGWLFERIEGDWPNVLGLPLLRVLDVLRRHGWRYEGGP
jgi:septum formation protein